MKESKPEEKVKWLGIVSIVIGALAFITSWIPIINNGSFGIAIFALILGIIALLFNLKKKKTLSLIGIILSIISMGIVLITQNMYSKAIDNSTNTVSTTNNSKTDAKKHNKVSSILNKNISIENGKAEITVTSWKVIPVGETGNEYGEKPLIAFWYKTKNIKMSDKQKYDPMSAWTFANIDAVQDNDKKQVNTLNVGSLPDDKYLDTQTQVIKKGATAENAASYELTDETTPVTLKIYSSLMDKDKEHLIAQQTFDIKK